MVSINPSTAWNKIEKYVRYERILMNGLWVIKYAYSLNARCPSSPVMKINWRFPNKCPTRKRHRNKPVKAIHHFFAIEDFRIADLLILPIYL
jgi:hypothetical protein